ncbi:MAG: hypothetical protein WC220_10790 [Pedobacter sp.]|jgi:hypothetical protein
MKNLILDSMGVHEMNTLEMQSTDGGVVLIIMAFCAVALTMSSCISPYIDVNYIKPEEVDPKSSSEETIDLAKRYNMPIGY